ncbi:unnamed protein product [Haemonchus placei]|uniref:EGF-like domain-containing protein n=1 Tax=Haemonchus placei TaxID=6290 RepID=A0A0N4WYV8_HAEPC|nr:unnamed protein product [Haemonchus placei]
MYCKLQVKNFLFMFNLSLQRLQKILLMFRALKIINKRDIFDNIRKNDPKSRCRNGGIYAGGQCHCIHPHTGKTCEEFACVHGISVGQRYDPLSLIFSKPCICDEGWKGDLCEYHLTERCGNRGEWKNNKCECIGSFFGDECQFTSRCDNGIIKHGRCICNKHFEGDYCERIICYHGYPNIKNMSQSCICPAKYKGLHCDQCSQVGPKIQPYPICTVNYIPSHARQSRKKTNQQVCQHFFTRLESVNFPQPVDREPWNQSLFVFIRSFTFTRLLGIQKNQLRQTDQNKVVVNIIK